MANEKQEQPKVLTVSPSPHVYDASTSRRIMIEVIIGLLPGTVMAVYLFGKSAVVVLLSALVGCLATEWVFNAVRRKPQTLHDGSGVVTGLILGLSMPANTHWWAVVIGSVVAVGVTKMLFGGLGANIFNPAMVGRAFLIVCFGTALTAQQAASQAARDEAGGELVARVEAEAVTGATPLALAKAPIKDAAKADLAVAQRATAAEVNTLIVPMFKGTIDGCAGETSALAWLIGGMFLLVRRTITWHVPAAVLGSAMVIATGAWLVNDTVYPNPLVHLFGGALMMGAFFIATDPVSCPLSKLGRVIFGVGVGAIVMLIRFKGGYPEGLMYAILLMNSMTPLLDRWTGPVPVGGHVAKPKAQGAS